MREQDRLYLERRAGEEIRQAQDAVDPAVVQIHYELASRYLDRIYGESPLDEIDRFID